jgi:hypothetical protein
MVQQKFFTKLATEDLGLMAELLIKMSSLRQSLTTTAVLIAFAATCMSAPTTAAGEGGHSPYYASWGGHLRSILEIPLSSPRMLVHDAKPVSV